MQRRKVTFKLFPNASEAERLTLARQRAKSKSLTRETPATTSCV